MKAFDRFLLLIHKNWDAAHPSCCPDEAANHHSPPGGLLSSAFKGVPYADVPVHGDADDDEDADVGVDEVRGLYEGAQQARHAGDRVVELWWQREEQQDVCQHQADHVHRGLALLPPKAAEHSQGQAVEQQPQDEGGDGEPQLHAPCQAVNGCEIAILTAVGHFCPETTKRVGWKCVRLTANAMIKTNQILPNTILELFGFELDTWSAFAYYRK